MRACEKSEKTPGPKFNIRAFHDAVLELGSVPLPVVTARIDRFIAEGDGEACGQSGGGELDFFFRQIANHCVVRSGGNKIDVMRFDNWASVQNSRTKKRDHF